MSLFVLLLLNLLAPLVVLAVLVKFLFSPRRGLLSEFFNDLNVNNPRLTEREERLAINAVELSRALIDRGLNEDWDMSKVEDEIMANLACSRSIALQIIESLTTQAEDF